MQYTPQICTVQLYCAMLMKVLSHTGHGKSRCGIVTTGLVSVSCRIQFPAIPHLDILCNVLFVSCAI